MYSCVSVEAADSHNINRKSCLGHQTNMISMICYISAEVWDWLNLVKYRRALGNLVEFQSL